MNITIVQGAFLPVPPLLGGAVEKIWFELGQAFARRGHQVTHISRACLRLPASEVHEQVRYLRIPGFDAPRSLPLLKVLDLIYSRRVLHLLPPADILVCNTFWLPLLARDRTRGLIYVHVARYPKRQLGLYRRAARLQAVSAAVAEAAVRQSPRTAARLKVIPNFVSVPCGHFDSDPYRSRLRQILYIGRVHPEKGLHLLLDAFREVLRSGFLDWELVIVGPVEARHGGGGEGFYRDLLARCQGMGARVRWMGPVFAPALLDRHYRQASLFVYPSLAERGESFGLAPLEAMAQACPPLVSSLACFREFIEDGRNGWFFDHRAANPARLLGRTLCRLLANPVARAQAAQQAALTARQYTLETVAETYLEDFSRLLEHGHASRPA